ncbi:eCIS core domain-containing protein [Polaribacter sp.]|uniref:eCIS core domain-containing protein n=1 Tax=Polaribacter sp. TaxID=1920175 RepID=UPI003EF8C128
MFAPKSNTKSSKPNTSIFGSNETDFIQPKLNVGKSGDKYELEADKAADTVVAKSKEPTSTFLAPSPTIQKQTEEDVQKQDSENEIQQKPVVETITPGVQLKANPYIQKQVEEDVQAKEEEEIQTKEEEEVLQTNSVAGADDTSGVEGTLNNSKGGGTSLDTGVKNEMESGFGSDFGGVRVHNDNKAVQMNQELGSQAFTNGNDIYFNEGKYNPESDSGKHLLAHELTHTVQQGASPSNNNVQKAEANVPAEVGVPATIIDITNGLSLSQDWITYLEENPKEKKFDIKVKIGNQFSGTIKIKKSGRPKEGENQKFELNSTKNNNYLDVQGMQFLDPLRGAGVYPVLVLNKFGDEQKTNGFLSIRKETVVVPNALGIIKGINENLEAMSFLGLSPIEVAEGLENKFENGGLNFKANNLSAGIDGYIEASGSMGITDSSFTFDLSSTVEVAGLASGEFNLARGEDGKLSGKANIGADIANINANLSIEYDKGAVTIQGTGKMNSEKFSGEITLLVTDAVKSRQMMNAALGVETMEAEVPATPAEAVPKTKGNQVLAGWGEVQATITSWLEGTAKIGIDSEGHVTIVGEIVVPDEIELMEQRGKKVDIFSVEIRAGYGIPLVGQVFLFAGIGMFVNAGFGPLVLKDIGFTGTYSTDPSVLQQFSITGTLGINAFAILGLEAEAGVGVTLLGHDLKAGVNVTAAAGLRAYAEATPTFQYEESASPQGGKVGESRLKGHFEAAAQLFLQLSGALFYELDSPWWSPAPDGREEFPLGEVQYPIGDSMGIGADMDWLVGSGEAPELAFSPVEFDPDKFTADVMADPPPKKHGKADASPAGEWTGEPGGEQEKDPTVTGEGKGLPENSKKKEDLKKLPDEQKYMRALDEMSKLEKAKPKPTYGVVDAKAKNIKKKYGLDKIQLKNKEDGSVSVFVKHAKEDNGKHLLKIPLMSEAERLLLLYNAMTDLRTREKATAGEIGTMDKSGAQEMLVAWLKAHPVVESAKVIDGKETWDYFIDIGDKSETEKGKMKKVTTEDTGSADKIKDKNKEETSVEITEADKKEHVKIANKIKISLSEDAVKGEDFIQFYKRKQEEAKKLENKYQPQLKKGINLEITFSALEKDQQDNDVDFNIKIAPNTTKVDGSAKGDESTKNVGWLDTYLDKKVVDENGEPLDKFIAALKLDIYKVGGKQVYILDKRTSGYKFRTGKGFGDYPQIYIESEGAEEGFLKQGKSKAYKPNHSNFLPKDLTIEETGTEYIVTYTTKRGHEDVDSSEPLPSFSIKIRFDEILDKLSNVPVETREVIGTNLNSKKSGVGRGKHNSAKAGSGFDNAHIIGDQFGGSGYNHGFNIHPSSSNYNKKEMGDVEQEMARKFKALNKNYNLTAKAYLQDDTNSIAPVKKILTEEYKKDNKADKSTEELAIKAQKRMVDSLQKRVTEDVIEHPAKFMKVEYESESLVGDFELKNREEKYNARDTEEKQFENNPFEEHKAEDIKKEDASGEEKITKKITIGEDVNYDNLMNTGEKNKTVEPLEENK